MSNPTIVLHKADEPRPDRRPRHPWHRRRRWRLLPYRPRLRLGFVVSLAHAKALAEAAEESPDAIIERYRAAAGPEARERHALLCATDDARSRHWGGEPSRSGRRDGCYPLVSFVGALAAAPHDDAVLRRTIRRIGMLDRTAVFDEDEELQSRIETILEGLGRPPPPGPPRDELLARIGEVLPGSNDRREWVAPP
jgi:hypothetical protein